MLPCSERARFMQMPERALSRAGNGLAHLLGGEKNYVAHNHKVHFFPFKASAII